MEDRFYENVNCFDTTFLLSPVFLRATIGSLGLLVTMLLNNNG